MSGDPDSQSVEERLESAAETLLCDVHHLQEIVDLLEDKGQVILYGPLRYREDLSGAGTGRVIGPRGRGSESSSVPPGVFLRGLL